MRRRTKPKVVWLPTTNTFSVDTANRSTWSVASVPAPTTLGSNASVLEVPVVMDGNLSDPLAATASLADIESSGYRLRRIVGKVYCFVAQTNSGSDGEDLYGVTAGFMVRRVNPSSGGSIAAATGNVSFLDPADIDNSMDPWIWRRSWLLSNGANTASTSPLTGVAFSDIMGSGGGFNYGVGYPGGISEGPHVDQKTARIIGPEERLFLDVSITPLLSMSQVTSLVVIYDLRVLASMRTNIGNRRNASR